MLGDLGDDFVLAGELGDRAPLVLLVDDDFVRRRLGAGVLKHPVEHRPGGGVGVVARVADASPARRS